LAGGACALALALAAPVAADELPLAQVPGQGPILVHVRSMMRTKDRLPVMAEIALPDLALQIRPHFADGILNGLEGRDWNRYAAQSGNGQQPR
jgi:hypothetical protein